MCDLARVVLDRAGVLAALKALQQDDQINMAFNEKCCVCVTIITCNMQDFDSSQCYAGEGGSIVTICEFLSKKLGGKFVYFKLYDLLGTLIKLAVNDENKRSIFEAGALDAVFKVR
jgi:hypothetical protein